MMHTKQNHSPHTAEQSYTDAGGPLDFSAFMTGFADDIRGYLRSQREYLSLHISEKVAVAMGNVVQQMVLFVALGMALLFLNLALAFYLGELLDSRPLGFVLVAVVYLLLLGGFSMWWSNGGRDRFILGRINALNSNDDHVPHT